MSIVVKKIKKASSCANCPLTLSVFCYPLDDYVGNYQRVHARPKDCPVIELPSEHGNLIDVDVVRKMIEELCKEYNLPLDAQSGGIGAKLIGLLDEIPPIVEEERQL